MKLFMNTIDAQIIEIDSDSVPCSFTIRLEDRTYGLTFRYNEIDDFFTVDLEIITLAENIPLVYGEVLRYEKPLFEAFNDNRYPLPIIVPLCFSGDAVSEITFDNFGKEVRLYLFERREG